MICLSRGHFSFTTLFFLYSATSITKMATTKTQQGPGPRYNAKESFSFGCLISMRLLRRPSFKCRLLINLSFSLFYVDVCNLISSPKSIPFRFLAHYEGLGRKLNIFISKFKIQISAMQLSGVSKLNKEFFPC